MGSTDAITECDLLEWCYSAWLVFTGIDPFILHWIDQYSMYSMFTETTNQHHGYQWNSSVFHQQIIEKLTCAFYYFNGHLLYIKWKLVRETTCIILTKTGLLGCHGNDLFFCCFPLPRDALFCVWAQPIKHHRRSHWHLSASGLQI